jgi:hypothetical protein
MMNANAIGNPTLRDRDDGSANDRHDHDSGTIARKRPKFGHAQGNGTHGTNTEENSRRRSQSPTANSREKAQNRCNDGD